MCDLPDIANNLKRILDIVSVIELRKIGVQRGSDWLRVTKVETRINPLAFEHYDLRSKSGECRMVWCSIVQCVLECVQWCGVRCGGGGIECCSVVVWLCMCVCVYVFLLPCVFLSLGHLWFLPSQWFFQVFLLFIYIVTYQNISNF